jgi:Transposase DDE domain.
MGQTAFLASEGRLEVLEEAFAEKKIETILGELGRQSVRVRKLPATMMVYYVIALGLFVSVGCREVLRRLLESSRWVWPSEVKLSTETAITKARKRLGYEVIERLYREVVKPIAARRSPGAFFRSWRVVSVDGSTLEVADSDANEKAFGRPGASRGKSAYPQIRFVTLLENGTHVLFGAVMDGFHVGEITLAAKVLVGLKRGMLCLADRNFFGYALWKQALTTRSALLWRIKKNLILPRLREHDDGSFESMIYPSLKDRRHKQNGIRVRVVEYHIHGFPDRYRLLTSILDPSKAPAKELALLYANRWTIETSLGEIKEYLPKKKMVLRSKLPDLVRQDFYGLLLAHFGIRSEMYEAAAEVHEDPTELSFVHALNVVHRKLHRLVSFPPSGPSFLPA